MALPPTPCFVISEARLRENLGRIARLKELSGARVLLALKCFSTWGVFDAVRPYLDGTTSSGPYEVRLGHERFGGETHAYSVGFSEDDIRSVNERADKLIFNSLSQLERLQGLVAPAISLGLRINPGTSYARQDKADPARRFSRLGVPYARLPAPGHAALARVEGAMFHVNCENADFAAYEKIVERISEVAGAHLDRMRWVSLGGGVAFTADGYPLDALGRLLRTFAARHGVQVYLEPGEAVVNGTTELHVTVLDIVDTGIKTAIVDSATEAHRLDTLIFDEPARFGGASPDGAHEYVIGSCSCLAGDAFGRARFAEALRVGDRLRVLDSGGYTMVKLNWFNGLRMPAVYCERANGRLELLNQLGYEDFERSLGKRDP